MILFGKPLRTFPDHAVTPQNYLHDVVWPDDHHRQRDAPPLQQDVGNSLKP